MSRKSTSRALQRILSPCYTAAEEERLSVWRAPGVEPPEDAVIIDAHTHLFPPEIRAQRTAYCARDPWFAELYRNPKARMATAEELVASMDAAGIDASLACPFGWSDPGIIEECNSYLLGAMQRYPGRIIGLAGIQPTAGARAVAELERCAQAGMPGGGELMPHGQGYRLSDLTLLAPLVEVARAHNLFILTHASEPVGHAYHGKGNVGPGDLEVFLRAFPDIRVLAAHWGGGFPFYELMPEVRAAAANLWYDSAASPFLYRNDIFPIAARLVGTRKLLFASDYPLIAQQRMLDYTRTSGLSAEELKLVLGENAQALLTPKHLEH
jgi:predicted TIM-barrel fold metal-dependent hydrolase